MPPAHAWRAPLGVFRTRAYQAEPFGRRLLRLARRRQLAAAVRLAPRATALALAIVLLASVPALLLGWQRVPAAVAAAVGVGAVLVVLAVARRVPPPLEAALAYDLRLRLQERLSSAVALRPNSDVEMRELQRADALAAANAIEPGRAFPLRVRRRELVSLALAAAFLALWFGLAQNSPLDGALTAPGPLVVVGQAVAETAGQLAPGELLVAAPPAVTAELVQLRSALAQLLRQIDPDAEASGGALRSTSQSLRRSAEGRQLGRALGAQDYGAAAAEARRLASELTQLNTGQLEELAQSLRAAAGQAAPDERIAAGLDAAAQALQRGAFSDSRQALEELARAVETIGAGLRNNEALRAQIADLKKQIAATQGADGVGATGEQDGLNGSGAGASSNEAAGAPGAPSSVQGGGGGDSAAQGRELLGLLEILPPEQRLNAEGRLEIVTIDPTAEGAERAERLVLELGTDSERRFDAAAGSQGLALGRADVDRRLPPELRPLLDNYFVSP